MSNGLLYLEYVSSTFILATQASLKSPIPQLSFSV